MSQLFIKLILDEDVDVLVADLLSAYGFDVVTTRDANLLGAADDVLLRYAVQQGRALLTHNRADFEALSVKYYETGREHHGIVLAVRRPPHEIARRALRILNHVTANEMKNQLRYI